MCVCVCVLSARIASERGFRASVSERRDDALVEEKGGEGVRLSSEGEDRGPVSATTDKRDPVSLLSQPSAAPLKAGGAATTRDRRACL